MYLAKESVCLHIHIHCMVHVNKILFHQMNLTCIHTLKCTHTTHTHTHTHTCAQIFCLIEMAHTQMCMHFHTLVHKHTYTHTHRHTPLPKCYFSLIMDACAYTHTHMHVCQINVRLPLILWELVYHTK